MGYSEALHAAGANVINYAEFGSYQGDWAAYVDLNGEKCIITGSYGSCSGCDSFQAEFGWADKPEKQGGKYFFRYEECSEEIYNEEINKYNERLANFGRHYLNNPSTKDIIQTRLNNLNQDDYFSNEEKEMLEWCLYQFNS